MKNKIVLKPIALIFGAAFAMLLFVGVQPAMGQSCDGMSDDDVVARIYAKIDADKNIADQKAHFNISFMNGAAILVGWMNNKSDYDQVLEYVNKTAYELPKGCMTKININNFWESESMAPAGLKAGGGCGPGTIQCGEICIPSGEKCQYSGAVQTKQEEDD